jgi:hypothetical protein
MALARPIPPARGGGRKALAKPSALAPPHPGPGPRGGTHLRMCLPVRKGTTRRRASGIPIPGEVSPGGAGERRMQQRGLAVLVAARATTTMQRAHCQLRKAKACKVPMPVRTKTPTEQGASAATKHAMTHGTATEALMDLNEDTWSKGIEQVQALATALSSTHKTNQKAIVSEHTLRTHRSTAALAPARATPSRRALLQVPKMHKATKVGQPGPWQHSTRCSMPAHKAVGEPSSAAHLPKQCRNRHPCQRPRPRHPRSHGHRNYNDRDGAAPRRTRKCSASRI